MSRGHSQAALARERIGALILLALLLLTLACYVGGLGGPLLLDDEPQLLPLLQSLEADNWQARARDFLISAFGLREHELAVLDLHGEFLNLGIEVREVFRGYPGI